MIKAQCNVCCDSLPLNLFRFLECGHGLCLDCTNAVRSNPLCAICRKPKGKVEPRQIYITIVGSTIEERAKNVSDRLDMIDTETPAISIERAGRKLKDIGKYLPPGSCVATELLEAADNLQKRLFPVFSDLERERKERTVLESQIDSLRDKIKVTESLGARNLALESQLRIARKDFEAALSATGKAKDHTLKQQEEVERLKITTQRQSGKITSQEQEIQQLQLSLEDREKQINLLKKKLKALAKSTKQPKFDIHDPDASLQVELPLPAPTPTSSHTPATGSQTGFHLKRRLADDIPAKSKPPNLSDALSLRSGDSRKKPKLFSS
ncbi:hypothetical protein BD779DRAFT_1503214 [Infundibulicybe gibba]|nr:hypothetical protein BD779DRAFT_1503214 [Infundibulicybe gibba]